MAYVRVFHALYVLCMVSTLLQNIYHMSNIVSDFFSRGKNTRVKTREFQAIQFRDRGLADGRPKSYYYYLLLCRLGGERGVFKVILPPP